MFSIVSNQFVRHCLFPLVVLIAFSNGCCVHPLQDDKGPDFTRSFYGATLKPNETVELQAKNHDGCWQTFHSTRTSGTPLRGWGGIEYYVWDCFDLYVPSNFWRDTYGISVNLCEVRVVNSMGEDLLTYEGQWTGDDFFSNPLIVWDAKGNREDFLRLWQHREF